MMSRTRRGRRFFGSVRADLFVPYEFVMRLPRSGEQLSEDGLQDAVLLVGILPERNEPRLHVSVDGASHGDRYFRE